MTEAINLLKELEQKGFKAYIVGGFVRDYLLNKESSDIDICTSATPKELKEIFDVNLKNMQYGSVTIIRNKVRLEITTMRKDIGYIGNRIPKKVKYIDSLFDDLKRRDFIVNTLCMNSSGEVIDLLDAKCDIENKLIKMVGNPRYRLKEDALRILRALRFATILNFNLDNSLKKYIKKYGYLLKKLSYFRKKEELDKIFLSQNKEKGINLIKELKLERYLEIDLSNITLTPSLIGIWIQCDKKEIYNYSNNEKELIKNAKELLNKDIFENYNLYKYGLYVTSIVGEIKKIEKKEIVLKYNELPIKSKKDICISPNEICNLLNKKPDNFLKIIMSDLEIHILNGSLSNNIDDIKGYIVKKYSIINF